jgi:hypothetical protein
MLKPPQVHVPDGFSFRASPRWTWPSSSPNSSNGHYVARQVRADSSIGPNRQIYQVLSHWLHPSFLSATKRLRSRAVCAPWSITNQSASTIRLFNTHLAKTLIRYSTQKANKSVRCAFPDDSMRYFNKGNDSPEHRHAIRKLYGGCPMISRRRFKTLSAFLPAHGFSHRIRFAPSAIEIIEWSRFMSNYRTNMISVI